MNNAQRTRAARARQQQWWREHCVENGTVTLVDLGRWCAWLGWMQAANEAASGRSKFGWTNQGHTEEAMSVDRARYLMYQLLEYIELGYEPWLTVDGVRALEALAMGSPADFPVRTGTTKHKLPPDHPMFRAATAELTSLKNLG